MNRFVRSVLLSCLLVFAASGSGCGPREVRIPLPPTPCVIPAFHAQQECRNSIPCLLTEFAETVQAEAQVLDALKTCPEVHIGK